MATNSSILLQTIISGAGSNTDAASYAMASAAPINGRVHFACVLSLKGSTPDTPTLSGTQGFNGTWTQIGSTVTLQTPAGNWIGVSWFWSRATSGTAGVITAAFGGNTQLGAVWWVGTGSFINTTTPTVQSGSNTDTSSSTSAPSLTLGAALSASANVVLVALAQQTGSTPAGNVTSPACIVMPGNSGSTSDGLALRVIATTANSFAPGSTTWTASVAKIIFGIEVAQDGTGASTSTFGAGVIDED